MDSIEREITSPRRGHDGDRFASTAAVSAARQPHGRCRPTARERTQLPERLIDPSTDKTTAARFDKVAVRVEAAIEASTPAKWVDQVHSAAT